ncbi:PilC/PilY family type IV pilus protein [Porticoccaceae bacterium LTM1]|nr:PilC/PilY family type IV pilus protein [Porticoccaceae bacterium LTM1]
MKKLLAVLLLPMTFLSQPSKADDIDIYLQSSAGSVPLLMMMLDWRPSVFATHCSSFDDACEATMSAGAAAALVNYRNTNSISLSDTVTRYEVFVAVMESLLSKTNVDGDLLFGSIHMALSISNFDNGGTILEGYNELGAEIPTDLTERSNYGDFETYWSNTNGGVDVPTPLYKDYLIWRLRQIKAPSNNSQSHKLQPSETFYEMYSYWNGLEVQYSDAAGTSNNFQSIVAPNPAFDATIQQDLLGLGISANYISPSQFTEFDCTNLYAIVMAMNVANQDDDLDSEIASAMPEDSASAKFENMLDYMADHDLVGSDITGTSATEDLITWVISDSGSKGSTTNWAAAGNSGQGVLNFDDAVELEEDLEAALVKIISVSSTFVASSVPVNVFNRTETLNSLFVALFEAQGTVDWPGNLKKLKLVDSIDVDSDGDGTADAGDGIFDDIVDANNVSAFEEIGDDKGRLKLTALTYWTDSANLPDPTESEQDDFVTGKDGRKVDRGGAGQQLPGFLTDVAPDMNSQTDARQLYLEPSSGSTFTALNATTAIAATLRSELGVSTDDEALELIRWARGRDVDDTDGDGDDTDVRSWILGSSIHSQPLALNYGTAGSHSESNPNIRLMMGSNDGFFHIYENTTSGGAESGEEVFAFMPRELLPNLVELRSDSRSSSAMIYGVDGTPTAFVVDNNSDGTISVADSDEAYVYFGLRRGGKSYYALDVSDVTANPTLKWKITNTDSDFSELGLTFSDPIVGKVKYGSSSVGVVIFAGGYNGGWNDALTDRVGKDLGDADDTIGNAIYIVNARTGALIWKATQGNSSASNTNYQHADMVDSIPSKVTAFDSNGDGIIDRLYVGDTGGAVWRVDLPEGDGTNSDHRKDNWFVSKLAELGTDGVTTDRRFFHQPEVVPTYDSVGDYDGVVITSGNRADPLNTDVVNYAFLIKDRNTTTGSSAARSATALTISDLDDVTGCVTRDDTNSACTSAKTNGWKLELGIAGEKGLASPLIDAGVVLFTSYAPTDAVSICDVTEGNGYVYLVELSDGSAVLDNQRSYDVGPGIPPSVVSIGNAIIIPGGGIGVDSDGDGIIDGSTKVGAPPRTVKSKFIIYWREPGMDEL